MSVVYAVTVIVVGLVGLLLGLGMGWMFRGQKVWCPSCGATMTCPDCNPPYRHALYSQTRRRPVAS